LNGSWKALCRESGLRYEGDAIRVECGEERYQHVHVDDSAPGVIRLWSRVAVRGLLRTDQVEIEAWLINRYRELVGLKVAERGTVIGEAWVPMAEVGPDEWALYVRTVARTCDRLEYLWTGVDRE